MSNVVPSVRTPVEAAREVVCDAAVASGALTRRPASGRDERALFAPSARALADG
jgi:hypothetical protein